MQYFRSLLFTTFYFVFTALYGVVVAISVLFPYRVRFALGSAWARATLWILKVTCSLDYHVEGLEQVPPGNYVSMWKHSSAWETISMMVMLPPAVWVLKRELIWIPFVGWGIAALKPIAINRSAGQSAITQVVEQGKQRLAEGLWVVIFPEGTRVGAGETRRYGAGGALLAIAANSKIIPVAHDAGDYWPRRGWLKQPGTIRVVFGPPIDPIPGNARATNEKVQAWIESTMTRIRAARAS